MNRQDKIREIAEHYKAIIDLLDIDHEIADTAMRAAKAIEYLTGGYEIDPHAIIKSALFKSDFQNMVIVKDIEFSSLCEHHLLPFFGKCHIAYLPNEYIIGLSKIPRIVKAISRRLQLQENLTKEIADTITEASNAFGAAVMIEANHSCMTIRGIKEVNSKTITSYMTGSFTDNESIKGEFYQMINR